ANFAHLAQPAGPGIAAGRPLVALPRARHRYPGNLPGLETRPPRTAASRAPALGDSYPRPAQLLPRTGRWTIGGARAARQVDLRQSSTACAWPGLGGRDLEHPPMAPPSLGGNFGPPAPHETPPPPFPLPTCS